MSYSATGTFDFTFDHTFSDPGPAQRKIVKMITELIHYFAKFPDRDGVMKLFARTGSSRFPEYYDELKTDIQALPSPLLPGIKDYICSTNIEVLGERIRNTKTYFLLLEYGAILASQPRRARNRETSFNLAVTVGCPYSKSNSDVVEESLIMGQCLEYLVKIARQMEQDNNQTCPFLQFVEGSIDFQPAEPALMFGCLGWTMTFTKLENDII